MHKFMTHRRFHTIWTTVLITILALFFLFPLVWMIVSSMKPESQIYANISNLKAFLPSKNIGDWGSAYASIFHRFPVMRYIFNSVFYAASVTIGSIVVNALAGYSLAKLNFPGKKIVLGLIIALYIVPFETVLLPLYLVSNGLGITNSYLALILPFVGNCFNIFLFRQFFMSMPKDLEEAASIDGCGPLKTFVRIVIPNSKPVLATATVLTVTTHWSDFMWPLISVTSKEYKTVQLAIQGFFTDPPVRYGPIMAALVFTTIPIIILFLLLQKYYVEGITSSGIKG